MAIKATKGLLELANPIDKMPNKIGMINAYRHASLYMQLKEKQTKIKERAI